MASQSADVGAFPAGYHHAVGWRPLAISMGDDFAGLQLDTRSYTRMLADAVAGLVTGSDLRRNV